MPLKLNENDKMTVIIDVQLNVKCVVYIMGEERYLIVFMGTFHLRNFYSKHSSIKINQIDINICVRLMYCNCKYECN